LPEDVTFAGNISYIIFNRKFGDFCTMSNLVLSHVIDLFAANKLV